MGILETIASPADLKRLEEAQIPALCGEIREFLVSHVSRTGGHLASNLGVVELTVAIHRVFDTSRDRLLFDVGHQCYVHKLLTGRRDQFNTLRSHGGLSGFPKPYESVHDAFVAGHASTAISEALGMARARTLRRENHSVLALVGDAAMAGGPAFEGLGDLGCSGEPLILLLNDNGMAITPSVGGVARHLAQLRMKPGYRSLKRWYRALVKRFPFLRGLYRLTHALKRALKRALLPCSIFEDVGLEYLGPVDGHNEPELEDALRLAKELNCPVVVHVITRKGKGYPPAELNPDMYHGVGEFDASEGVVPDGENFSATFGKTLTELAGVDGRICAVTAAMETGTGLSKFAASFPKRCFDVGIAEGHAISMAAGLAAAGMRPVAAVYSTFLQRGYDMLFQDIALARVPAVIAVDRCGLVGADGETHQGLWDSAYLCQLPGVEVWSPASYGELRDMLTHCLTLDGPSAIRYPRGCEGRYGDGGADPVRLLREGDDGVMVTCGILVNEALEAAALLEQRGISVSVVKLGRIAPLDGAALLPLLRGKTVMVLEEAARTGGIGERVAALCAPEGAAYGPLLLRNTGDRFIPQGNRRELLHDCGIDAASAADAMTEVIVHGG